MYSLHADHWKIYFLLVSQQASQIKINATQRTLRTLRTLRIQNNFSHFRVALLSADPRPSLSDQSYFFRRKKTLATATRTTSPSPLDAAMKFDKSNPFE
jgi:hypothetical protein